MFLWLSQHFRGDFGPLNVFRYVTFRSIGAMATALMIAMWLFPWFIRLLQEKQIGQVVRDDGPQSHFSKKGTPTMGGILLLMAVFLSTLLWGDLQNVFVWLTLVVTLVFGVLGFIDDFLKIRDRNSKGVTERQKLATQFGVTALVFGLMYFGWFGKELQDTRLYLPFASVKHFAWDIGPIAYTIFACVTVAGYSNAVNLTDGLDGLAIGPVMISSFTFAVLCYLGGAKFGHFDVAQYLLMPEVPEAHELTIVLASVIGAGIHGRRRRARRRRHARHGRGVFQERTAVAHRQRPVRRGSRQRRAAALLLQAYRQADPAHGANPPSFREAGLAGTARHDSLLDHLGHVVAGRVGQPEVEVTHGARDELKHGCDCQRRRTGTARRL